MYVKSVQLPAYQSASFTTPTTTTYFAEGVVGWCDGLGKLPVPWRLTEKGPTALAVGAGTVVWPFLLSSIFTLLFLPRLGRRPDID